MGACRARSSWCPAGIGITGSGRSTRMHQYRVRAGAIGTEAETAGTVAPITGPAADTIMGVAADTVTDTITDVIIESHRRFDESHRRLVVARR